MLDKKRYEEQLQKERERQIEEISKYLADYIKINAKIRDLPFVPDTSKELLDEIEAMEIPRTGRGSKEVCDEMVEKIYQKSMLIQHPRLLSFVTCAVSPYSIAGGLLNAIYNPNLGGFTTAPAANVIEEKLVKWMGSLAGFDDKCGGLFTSGGSLSNLTGCIAARIDILEEHELPIAVAYASDQAHSSIKKGMKLMGLRKDQIRIIPTDDDFKIRVDILESMIKDDITKGNKPFLIVGNLGSTNTGSIDPLNELADIRDKYNMWLHVDGAFGGSILFSDIYRNYAKGIERVDSLSWDTHKWGLQSYSSSTIIVRDKKKLIKTYAEHPEYLTDILDAEHTDGWDLGIEMSRPANCLKLWYTVQAMGTDLLSDVIDYSFHNSNIACKQIESHPDFEVTSKPMCGTITFRYVPKDVDPSKYDDLNAEISKVIIEQNIAYVVTTVIKEKRVLRLNIINPNTTVEDIVITVDALYKIGESIKNKYM